ncbi:MAG: helix-turn-helix transcriptional regulator [Clostridiales bacterium]|nr:helix-turn-helix transcriptional regulator [Clostridiales bacterium]
MYNLLIAEDEQLLRESLGHLMQASCEEPAQALARFENLLRQGLRGQAAACLEEAGRAMRRQMEISRDAAQLFAMRAVQLAEAVAAGAEPSASRAGDCMFRLISSCDTIDTSFASAIAGIQELVAAGPRPGAKKPKKVLQRSLQYMNEHYAERISLETVAAHAGIHPAHLSRLFHQEWSGTFKETLTEIRLGRAKELLRQSDMKVYQIAGQVGFRKARYFSELFRNSMGMTPMEYRERQ